MKKILCILLLSVLVFSLAACSGGGGPTLNEDGLVEYSESGLEFALPEQMTKRSVNYADICYGDGTAEFFVFFYSRDALLTDCFLDKDASVKEYAEWCIDFSRCTEVDEKYNEAQKRLQISFVADDTQYIAIIMRNNDSLIHATMCCPVESRAEYAESFELWKKYVALTYPDR